jgi:hypothetical protein
LKGQKDIKKIIEQDQHVRRARQKNKTKDIEEDEKVQDKKRTFLNMMRPPYYWNFFEDEEHTPHVLRHDAKPQDCYIDGRVEEILRLI